MIHAGPDGVETEQISLLDSLDGEWIKLPLAVMQDTGPAVQTLGGLLKLTNRETYSTVSEIAGKARVPIPTARKHLITLDDAGWIANKGRQHTRRGAPRRTATIALAEKARNAAEEYSVLPWWACCHVRNAGKMPWCAKAVLSVVVARLMSLKAAVERQDGHGMEADDVIGSIANMGDDDRFRFSLAWLVKQTGLTHDSVTTAKRLLNHRYGIVEWSGTEQQRNRFAPGVTPDTDLLLPNWEFRVVVTPTQNGRWWIDFGGTRKVGNR